MAARYVLDTDVVIDLLRGRAVVRDRLAAQSPQDVAVTAITVAELRYGALASSEPARNSGEVERFLEQIRVLAFGRRAAVAHARLRFQLRAAPIGPHDLLIAATVVASDAVLVSSNTREYSRVTELRLENWRE